MPNKQWKPRRRIRRMARRSSVVWWSAAVALGLITAGVVNSAVQRSTAAADAWGSDRRVWVVQRSVRAGDALGPADVRLERRPKRVVPGGALDAESSPVGEATRVGLVRGEVVLTQRLAGRGAQGLAALVEAGRRAIAFKNDEAMPRLRPGDRVDVLATFDAADGLDTSAGPTAAEAPSFAVATNAEVLTISARAVTVSVLNREAPRVAFALARAAVTLALRGGASEPAQSR